MEWFRLYAEFATDPKVQMMPEAMQRRLIMVMCASCTNNLAAMDDESVSLSLGISKISTIETKNLFIKKGFINHNWQLTDGLRIGVNRPNAGVWAAIRRMIFERDDYTCQYCGQRGGRLECDHVIPVSRGGNSEHGNLKTACFACNRSKRNKLLSEWRVS